MTRTRTPSRPLFRTNCSRTSQSLRMFKLTWLVNSAPSDRNCSVDQLSDTLNSVCLQHRIMTGQTVSHYEIADKIGEGGMGVVWKARDIHLDRWVALKTLPAQFVADESRRTRFLREARAASALNHAHIVTIHDFVDAGGNYFLVMEHIEGKSLDCLIPRKGLRLPELLRIAIPAADALAAAHKAGIVHRDVKPGNILVPNQGKVKILDFGLAKRIDEVPLSEGETTRTSLQETEEGVVIGTVAYMSPEQAQGKPVDARSDIFSFGAMLYEMATGERAFQGDSKLSTLSAVLKDEPKPGADMPRELAKIISRCLRKDPERRLQSMADLRLALEELKEESESGALLEQPAASASANDAACMAGDPCDRCYCRGRPVAFEAKPAGTGITAHRLQPQAVDHVCRDREHSDTLAGR